MGKTIDHVRRISDANMTELKKLMDGESKASLNEVLATLLDTYKSLADSPVLYANKLYTDVAEARGEAIMEAVKNATVPKMPMIVAIIGNDGDAT